jgi:hypothetical protein
MSHRLCVLVLTYACRLVVLTLECCNEVGSVNLELPELESLFIEHCEVRAALHRVAATAC